MSDGAQPTHVVRERRAQTVVAAVMAALPLPAVAIAAAVFGPRLGSAMASHWGLGGPANGFAPTWASFWTFAAISSASAVAATVLTVFAGRGSIPRVYPAVLAFIAGSLALAWIVPAWATVVAPSPESARLGAHMLVMAAAATSGVVIYFLLPATAPASSGEATHPMAPLDPPGATSWSGVTGSRLLEAIAGLMIVLFLGFIAIAVVLRQGSAWTGVVIFGLAALLCLALARVRLTVDRRGIRLSSALLGLPVIRIRLDNIDSVTADLIEPMNWGGWGLRISGAGIAYVARRGPGLIVARRTGGAVAITIDRPEAPAAVANALVGRRAPR